MPVAAMAATVSRVHAAAGFEENLFFSADLDGFVELVVRHVVEEDDVDAAEATEEADLVEGVGFDFDEDFRRAFFGCVDGELESGSIAGDGEMVVLGQHAVVEAEAVVGAAAGADGEALEFAESGSGLAGVEDDGACSSHGVDEVTGQGGDAAETLEEIERGAFGGEKGAGGAGGGEDEVTGSEDVAVVFAEGNFDGGIDLAEDFSSDFGAGEDGVFLGDDAGRRMVVGGNEAFRRDIAGAEVFGEGAGDGFAGGWGHRGCGRLGQPSLPGDGFVELEQVALPRKEAGAVLGGDGHEGQARGDEGRVDGEVFGDGIAFFAELLEEAAGGAAGTRFAFAFEDRPLTFGEFEGGTERFFHAAVARGGHAVDFDFVTGHGSAGGVDQAVVGNDVEGRPVPRAGFGVAPVPEGAEDGGFAGGEFAAAGDAPGIFHVTFAGFAGALHHGIAGLTIPFPAAEFAELLLEDFGEGEEIADVVEGVFFHARRERPASPVGALRGFAQRDAEKFLHQGGVADLFESEETRGDGGVENFGGVEGGMASEQAQIVIGAVDDDGVRGERGVKGGKVEALGQRVDEEEAVGRTDLHEADFFAVAVQAVGFGIDADDRVRVEAGGEVRELFRRGDQGSAMKACSGEGSPARRARGSRTSVVPSTGAVTNGPPPRGAGSVKATSGTSLNLPSRGKSLRRGW